MNESLMHCAGVKILCFGVYTQLRYLLLWMLSIPLAFAMHYALRPSKVGTAVRHYYATTLGVLMGVLCFGW